MKNILAITAAAVAAWTGVAAAQAAGTQAPVQNPPEQSAPVASDAPAGGGLADLDAMTFGCPKAGLNAAAREAATVESQGTYQFSYFRIVSDSHHALYEIHFKSNYVGEKDLKYCVAVYCQQGWDPKTTKTTVTSMGDAQKAAKGAGHGADCSVKPPPVKRPVRR